MKKNLQLLAVVIIVLLLVIFVRGYWDRWVLEMLNIIISLTVLLIGVVIFFENRDPSKTISWLIVLASFPIVGFIFYIVFGQSYRKRRLFRKRTFFDDHVMQQLYETEGENHHAHLALLGEHQQTFLKLSKRLGKSPISFTTETKVLTNGKVTYEAIYRAIKEARHHIHLEYYIVRDDTVGTKFKDLLIEKAREGVEVRFLYDAVGSWLLSKGYRKELEAAGAQVVSFFPVKLPFLNHKVNYRNHRKIVVIDGNVGFIGGLNIGDEYLGQKKNGFPFWRDTHLMVKGEAVHSLQLIFLQDWYYMTGESIMSPAYMPARPVKEANLGGVQMVASGPDEEWESIKHLFFSMIVSAKKSIWIASPYFIPDADILTALRIAALSGIDVKILVPVRPDKRIVFYASRSYFPELLEAGVKIHEYERGFMHSKIIIVDGELASIGTANMDMRSFHLNFEVNAFLFRTSSTNELVTDFREDLLHSREITLDQFKRRSLLSRTIESTSRLLSPLL
ncbi:MAG TPA: cardiolipin synthase [Bacillales bacterium]|nr:cardiolipin synthase [Bacillales bacterium]